MVPEMAEESENSTIFFTVASIAQRWQCSSKKVRRMIERRELAAYRFGGQWRIRDVDLMTYERLCRVDPRSVPDVLK